jgi:hypothetical protein
VKVPAGICSAVLLLTKVTLSPAWTLGAAGAKASTSVWEVLVPSSTLPTRRAVGVLGADGPGVD